MVPGDSLLLRFCGGGRPAELAAVVVRHGKSARPCAISTWKVAVLQEDADWRGNSELDGSSCQNLLYFRHLPSPPQTANGSGSFGAGGAKALTHHRPSHTNEREQSSLSNRFWMSGDINTFSTTRVSWSVHTLANVCNHLAHERNLAPSGPATPGELEPLIELKS